MSLYQSDFPIFKNLGTDEQPYIYLDSAATTLKPQNVIDAVSYYYTHCGANVHRGNYKASEVATLLYENTRSSIAEFINAKKHEIIFSRSTTDGINFLADLLELKNNDIIINCIQEHHSNFIPWNEKAHLITIELSSEGLIDLEKLEDSLKKHSVKLVTVAFASNVTGNVQPVEDIIALAKQYHALVCIDAAQIVSHKAIDMQNLGADFLVFSSHKMFGPTGVGVLYIHEDILSNMPYKRFGGGIVNVYNLKQKLFKKPPLGFEPGTPAIEAVIGFGKAIEYLQNIGFETIKSHLDSWSIYFLKLLENSPWTLAFPKSSESLAIFTLRPKGRDIDISYLARLLSDTHNIAVSDGQQCSGPLYSSTNFSSGLRISAQLYNSLTDIDIFFNSLEKLSFFSKQTR